MSTYIEYMIGVAELVLGAIIIIVYLAWNMIVKKRKIKSLVEKTKRKLRYGKGKEELDYLLETTPQVTCEITGISVSIVVLAITMFSGIVKWSFEYELGVIGMISIAVAALCLLMIMEQLLTAISPSTSLGEKMRLYEEAARLKIIGFTSLWVGILFLMATVDIYVLTIVVILTIYIVIRYIEMRWEDAK
ncbi:MAG: hypothetical protein J7K68_00660 [Candidatus Diapherotrites archaeon]|nr:hypothetical protein [Candidatus Diapherotrites archaeon]